MRADANGDLLDRRARIATAALRAAYAWSVRERERRAFEEIARMTGVIMFELGPGVGPATPSDLVRCLREPMSGVLPPLPPNAVGQDGTCIDGITLLGNDDTLTDAAYMVGSDYIREVIASRDPGRDWLPSWSWMRANDVEHALFDRLISSGSDADYRTARRFIVEHPAGGEQELAAACNHAGAERAARYVPIPDGQTFALAGSRWWWPCPACKWPMDVAEGVARCRYGYHQAAFQIVDGGRGKPRLVAVDPMPARVGQRGAVECREARDGIQVDEPVWRFIVVPGATELRISRQLEKAGARVELYPRCDRYDLDVTVDDQRWDVDVKEHSAVEGLLRHVREKPPAARYLVLPHTHRGQVHAVRDALPDYTVLTEDELVTQVKKAVRRWKRSTR